MVEPNLCSCAESARAIAFGGWRLADHTYCSDFLHRSLKPDNQDQPARAPVGCTRRRVRSPSHPHILHWQFTDNKWQSTGSGRLRGHLNFGSMMRLSLVGRLRAWASAVAGCGLALLFACAASATPPPVPAFEEAQPGQATNNAGTSLSGLVARLRRSNYLLGDMWGLRRWLSKYGMSLSILETSEVLGNVSGGAQARV